jgi:hypothetical protein
VAFLLRFPAMPMTQKPLYRSLFACGAVLLCWLGAACGTSGGRQCNVGADCASGACNADGTCVAVAGGDAGGDGSSEGGGPVGDGSPIMGADGASTFDAGGCPANHDGVLTHDEVPLAAGLKATFRVATSETIDTSGGKNADGTRTWDFTGKLASDQDVIVETLSVTGAWYAKDFATATYASKLSQSQATLGVFNYGTDSLGLIGVVSPTNGTAMDTELTYAPSVPILKFPFMKDSAWTTTAQVSGKLNGTALLTSYTEKYESTVDATGTLKTPFASFPVLRVGTVLTQTFGVIVTVTRTFAWVTECYGTVAKATSTSNETLPEFTQAAELLRLAP